MDVAKRMANFTIYKRRTPLDTGKELGDKDGQSRKLPVQGTSVFEHAT